uniref:Glutathione S-transferase 3, mitochondrial n=1 Tax=Ornithodoros turicata TaxID=34597 RepID=A0A2R5LGJ6_9ACAR
MTLTLQREYGYVVLVGVGSAFVNLWHQSLVGRARKKYDVKYPAMYSDKNMVFNCIQRAHQNYLENYPQFLFLLFAGSLEHPVLGAAAGAVYLAGRVCYAVGYSTGDPSKRYRGAFQYLGLLTLLGTTIKLGVHMLGYL